jgi:acyl-CoA thioester hydrolase
MGARAEVSAEPVDHFRWPVRIYWEDTDAGGIVFYANYLKFFERARTEWLRGLAPSQQALREAGLGMFVVTETSVRYLSPARLDDELIVTVRLSQLGRASLSVFQQAWCGDRLLASGDIRIGWVQATADGSLKPGRLPQEVLSVLPAPNNGAQSGS